MAEAPEAVKAEPEVFVVVVVVAVLLLLLDLDTSALLISNTSPLLEMGWCPLFASSIGELAKECEVNEEWGDPLAWLVLGECDEVIEKGDVTLSISKSVDGDFLVILLPRDSCEMLDTCCDCKYCCC